MDLYHYLLLALLYALCGNLYTLTYCLIFKPAAADATIGILILAWPLVIVLDVLLAITQAFGKTTKALYEKLKNTGI